MLVGSHRNAQDRIPDQDRKRPDTRGTVQRDAPIDSGPVGPLPPGFQSDALASAKDRLEVILHDGAEHQRMVYPLTLPNTTIGRDPSNDIIIDSPVIPRFFAVIERQDDVHPPRFVVRDTTAALFYRGRRVEEQPLTSGDILRAGAPTGSVVTFVYHEKLDAALGDRTPYGRHIPIPAGQSLDIGRAPTNQLVLDDENVAPHHARISRDESGQVTITDLGRTTGTFVNGLGVERARLVPGAEVRVGSHRFVFTGDELMQASESGNVRVDAVDLTQWVKTGGIGPIGRQTKILLDHVSLSILPGTFVAIVGASGSGKTTLLGALNGQRPIKSGTVLYNGEDFYKNVGDFSTSLGYVPQDDIVHKNLTVEKALYYAARLRLPKGTRRQQIKQRITEVLEDVELEDQRNQVISSLSGGQRKRVNVALELLDRPALFYLDEPTSGLDPGLDRKMMQLMRRLADRGHTVVLATHATSNINVADYVCFMAPGGRLAFFGTPDELKRHFGKTDYAEIYNEVDADPVRWAGMFRQSPEYLKYIEGPRAQSSARAAAIERKQPHQQAARRGRSDQWRQFVLLTRRYFNLMLHDRMNLLILLLQAPIIAVLIDLIATSDTVHKVTTAAERIHPTDYDAQRTLFIMVASAIWFGIINAAREIVKESAIYRRERSVNLAILPYVLSKVVVLGVLCLIQDFLLLIIVGQKVGYPTHGVIWSGMRGGFAELYITLLLSSLVGLMLGLLVSALAPNTDRAVSITPILLIPQIIFANVIFTLSSTIGKWISYVTPARWGMQAAGSIAGLHDRFSAQDKPFYTSDAQHVLGWWTALVALTIAFFLLTLLLQKRKDVMG